MTVTLLKYYLRKKQDKSGRWSAPKQILSFYHAARPITVPGIYMRVRTIPIEDLLSATSEEILAVTVQEGNEFLVVLLSVLMSMSKFSYKDSLENTGSDIQVYNTYDDTDLYDEVSTFIPAVGYQVSVFWPDENQHYDGLVHSKEEHLNLNVYYGDGDTKCLYMT